MRGMIHHFISRGVNLTKNAAPELFIEKIITAVQEHSGSTPQSDDMTLMIIKRDTE
jgi:serine phosphatase RsbU (regulator of sigma subunit)